MEKRTKLGVAATSLAVAATMIGPATASADTFCDKCLTPADGLVFHKLTDAYNKIQTVLGEVPESVFIKFDLNLG